MADSISASPQQPVLGAIARALKFREQTQQGLNSPTGALLDLILPTSQTVEKWSYGDPIMRMPPPGTGGYVPVPTRDKEYLAESLAYAPVNLAGKAATAGAAGVIKPKGGNWLAGQVERAVAPIKRGDLDTMTRQIQQTQPDANVLEFSRLYQEQFPEDTAINKWLDSKLTKYIKNEMATPEDPLRLQADRWATEQQPKLLAEKQAQLDKAKADMEKAQRERGVEPEMLTRSRARILELEKERDFIAGRTGLHYSPPQTGPIYRSQLEAERSIYGFPIEGLAVSPQAKRWEDLTDTYLGKRSRAGDIIQPNYYLRPEDAQRVYAENPWLFKVPPETDVNLVNRGISQNETGFKHMVDELRNAMNPDSGLPKELQITAKDLDKMTVPQVAELVDKINAHRVVQKAEADALAAQKSIVVHKEYPDSPQGMRWVEMKLTDNAKELPKNWSIEDGVMGGKTVYYVADEKGKNVLKDFGFKAFDSEQEALDAALKEVNKRELETALKYEGDVMSHCVGGYCPDVVRGYSRIFSLRDAKGKPQVTIEVAPEPLTPQDLPEAISAEYRKHMQEGISAHGGRPGADEWVQHFHPDVYEQIKKPLRIEQIKGYKNDRPPEDMMPYIHDFIKDGQWSSVKDLNHTDLVPLKPGFLKNAADRNIPVDVITQINDQPYITKQEFNRLADAFGGVNKYPEAKSHGGAVGMAAGGLVEFNPERINALAQDIQAGRYATGGAVSANDYNEGKIQALAESILEELHG